MASSYRSCSCRRNSTIGSRNSYLISSRVSSYSNSYSYGLASYSRGLICGSGYASYARNGRSNYSVSSTSIALSRSARILNVGLQLVVGVNEDSLDLIVAGLCFVEDSCVSVVIAEGLGVSNNGVVVRLLLVIGVNADLNGVRSQGPSSILTVDNLTINANLVGGGDDALILNGLNLNYCETVVPVVDSTLTSELLALASEAMIGYSTKSPRYAEQEEPSTFRVTSSEPFQMVS